MNRTPFTSILALVLAAALLIPVLPASANARKSSSAIQEELNNLKGENKELQAEINKIQSKYDANASEIQDLVDQKTPLIRRYLF